MADIIFIGLDAALVLGAGLLLLRILVRRGRGAPELMLAALLILLAGTIWYLGIRAPLGGR